MKLNSEHSKKSKTYGISGDTCVIYWQCTQVIWHWLVISVSHCCLSNLHLLATPWNISPDIIIQLWILYGCWLFIAPADDVYIAWREHIRTIQSLILKFCMYRMPLQIEFSRKITLEALCTLAAWQLKSASLSPISPLPLSLWQASILHGQTLSLAKES